MKNIVIMMLCLMSVNVYAQEEIVDKEPIKEDVIKNVDNEDIDFEEATIYDPLEKINRKVYILNSKIDDGIIRPIAVIYKDAVPNKIQTGVKNLMNYLKTPLNIVYFTLQGNQVKAGNAIGRLITNTFSLGLIDIASHAHMPLDDTSFGETMGVWGVNEGPYIVLPIIGGNTLRDNLGKVVVDIPYSIEMQMPIAERNTLWVLETTEKRKQYLDIDNLAKEASLDEYIFVRDYIVKNKRKIIDNLKEKSQ